MDAADLPRAMARPQILIVDDDLMSLEMLPAILGENYTVLTAQSGQHALDLLTQFQPDLMLLDVVMPGMDGYTLFQQIRGLPQFQATPILFLSCLSEPIAEAMGLEMGACDYISKPFDPLLVRLRIGNQLLLRQQAALLDRQCRELQMRDAFFQQIFHCHSEPFLLIEPDSARIIDANKAAAEFYGYEHEELIGMPITAINLPVPTGLDTVGTQAVPLENTGLVFFHRIKTGEIRTVEVHSTPIDIQGKTVLFSIVHDITERRQREAELQQIREQMEVSEHNFRAFFDTIDYLLFVLDEDGQILKSNQAVRVRLGYTEAELTGSHVLMLHPPERREEAAAIVTQMQAGTVSFCPVPLLCKDGTLIPVETRVTRGSWNGKPAFFGISKDISDLRESEEKFSRAFQSNPALMSISTIEEGVLLDVNAAFLELLGFSREEVLGKTSVELGLLHSTGVRTEIRDMALQYGSVRNRQITVFSKSGQCYHGLLSTDIIRLQSRDVLLNVMVDITGRVKAELQLAEARDAAEAASRSKSEFLADMSHEIRTPMNGVLGMTQLLRFTQLSPEQEKYLENIEACSDTLLGIINDVLDLSRIESGRIELEFEPFSLRQAIQQVISTHIVQVHQKKLYLKQELAADLPDRLCGDLLRFKQILQNLMSNAIKFTVTGGVMISASLLKATPEKVVIRIVVSDTGIGMCPDALKRIFNPFEQADAGIPRRFGGTGLGLAITLKLVELMGGTITVESIPDCGSSFSTDIPFACCPDEPFERPLPFCLPQAGPERPLTILVVEDNSINRQTLELLLQKLGHRTMSATNGEHALRLWQQGEVDLVIMDIHLPVMNGIMSLQAIRQLEQVNGLEHTPVIALTADALHGTAERLLQAGFDAYLSKPVNIRALALELQRFYAA